MRRQKNDANEREALETRSFSKSFANESASPAKPLGRSTASAPLVLLNGVGSAVDG